MDTQTVSGGETTAADLTHGISAMPGLMFAASDFVSQELATARHRANRGASGKTCRDKGTFSLDRATVAPHGYGSCKDLRADFGRVELK